MPETTFLNHLAQSHLRERRRDVGSTHDDREVERVRHVRLVRFGEPEHGLLDEAAESGLGGLARSDLCSGIGSQIRQQGSMSCTLWFEVLQRTQ